MSEKLTESGDVHDRVMTGDRASQEKQNRRRLSGLIRNY
jgi:hypothetical protein